MSSTVEKIQSLSEKIEDDTRKDTINDVLIDLEASLQHAKPGEEMGIRAAMEIISSNYDH